MDENLFRLIAELEEEEKEQRSSIAIQVDPFSKPFRG